MDDTPQNRARVERLARDIKDRLLLDLEKHRDPGADIILHGIGNAARHILLLIPPEHRGAARAMLVEILDIPLREDEAALQAQLHGRPH